LWTTVFLIEIVTWRQCLWPNKLIIIVIFQITWRHELKTIICLISSVLWSSMSEAWSAGPPHEWGLGRSTHLPPSNTASGVRDSVTIVRACVMNGTETYAVWAVSPVQVRTMGGNSWWGWMVNHRSQCCLTWELYCLSCHWSCFYDSFCRSSLIDEACRESVPTEVVRV